MESLFQPAHLIVILIIVLVLFGPAKLPNLGQGFGRATSDLRGALFVAKGVDPTVGRDVGDMLPDEDAGRRRTWLIFLLAILIGNTLYLLFLPILPVAARMDTASASGLPALVDLWLCLCTFGVLNLMRLLHSRNKPKD